MSLRAVPVSLLLPLLAACGGSSQTSPVSPSVRFEDSLPSCGPPPPHVVPLEPLPCPSRAEVQQLQRDVPVTFDDDTASGGLVCQAAEGSVDLTYVRASFYQGLLFLSRLSFDRPLPWTSESVYGWLRSLGLRIVVSAGTSNPYYERGTAHFFYDPDKYASSSMIMIDGTPFEGIVHEARHADGVRHTCNGGTSDERVDEMGSYGVQYYLLKWIADYSHESQDVRDYANYRAWVLRSGPAFCAECRRTEAGPAAIDVSIAPDPIVAIPVGSAGQWGAVFQCRIAETAGVDVTVVSIEFTVRETTTGQVVSRPTMTSLPLPIRAWSSTTVTFSASAPLLYSPSTTGHDATLTVLVQARDADGNSISQSTTAEIR